MTSISTARPGGAPRAQRVTVAIVVGVVAELALLGALAYAAWSPYDSENTPPLTLGGGLTALAYLGGPCSLLVLGACFSIASPKRWGAAASAVLLFLAGVGGFVAFALTSFSRMEMSDC